MRGEIVIVDVLGEMHEFSLQQILTNEKTWYWFNTLISFKQYLRILESSGGRCINRGNDYLCESFGGLKHVVRKFHTEDIHAGPLGEIRQEPLEFRVFVKVLRSSRNPLVIDVGAYVGAYSLRACREGARVIALEPDPDNLAILRMNIELNECTDRVKPLMIAAGSKEELLPLYKGVSFDTSSIVQSFRAATSEVEAYVKVDTLDNILTREGLAPGSRIDYLKIDVEGAEVDVLRGAVETLKRTRYLQVEVFDQNLDEVKTMLGRCGFRKLAEIRYEGYRNLIFEKRS